MPVFLEPDCKFPVVLDSDADKPIETRPTFYAKSQSMRGQERIGEILDRLTTDNNVTQKQLFDDACQVLSEVVCDWENMSGIPYVGTPDSFRGILDYAESRELLRKVMHNQRISSDQKKS